MTILRLFFFRLQLMRMKEAQLAQKAAAVDRVRNRIRADPNLSGAQRAALLTVENERSRAITQAWARLIKKQSRH